jgi:predicted ester cyclase
MIEHNIATVKRWFEEVWNQRCEETIDELITPESICYTDGELMIGTEGFRQKQYLPFVTAFPDLHVNIEAAVGQNEVVVVRWSAIGTHTGDGIGIPPTYKSVEFRGISWIHIRNGKMMEGWQSTNIPQVLMELATPLQSAP